MTLPAVRYTFGLVDITSNRIIPTQGIFVRRPPELEGLMITARGVAYRALRPVPTMQGDQARYNYHRALNVDSINQLTQEQMAEREALMASADEAHYTPIEMSLELFDRIANAVSVISNAAMPKEVVMSTRLKLRATILQSGLLA